MIWVIFRILHIAATCASLGGLLYARAVLLPNLRFVGIAEREVFLAKMIKRYAYIKWTGICVVAITGIAQWLHIYPTVANKELYLLAFALKMAGAIGLFTITAMLALPHPRFKTLQDNRRFWTGISLLCALTIIAGAALMKHSH